MNRLIALALLTLVVLAAPACIIVDRHNEPVPTYDFNGQWTFAITGCQAQSGTVASIVQSGQSISMSTSQHVWSGTCDPVVGSFSVTANESWGSWTFQGTATSDTTLQGTYLFVDFVAGQCSGNFTAVWTAPLAAARPAGELGPIRP